MFLTLTRRNPVRESRRAQFVEKEKGARRDGLIRSAGKSLGVVVFLENLQPTLRNVGNSKSDRGGREPKTSRFGCMGTIFSSQNGSLE